MQTRLLIITAFFAVCLRAQNAPRAAVAEADFRFPQALAGEVIEHGYVLRNTGDAPLRLKKADMTPPLRPTKMPASVLPGEEAIVHFRLDTSKLTSAVKELYEGKVVLYTDDPARPEIELTFQGEVVPRIEFSPLPAFFVTAQRGESKSAAIEILNHRQQPLEILKAESASSRFSLHLETLTPGQHYRLSLTTRPDAAPGKAAEMIALATSDAASPVLKVQANALIRERVYTFPERLDFGRLEPRQLQGNLELIGRVSETLMIYQAGGKDFRITVRSDVPFLDLHPVRSELGDRYQTEVTVVPERMTPGEVSGAITIITNDPEFPEVTVPVKAFVTSGP